MGNKATEVFVDRDAIIAALGRVWATVDRRATLPILSHVRLNVLLRGAIEVSATDLEIFAVVELAAEVPHAGFSICAPGGLLKQALANLPDGTCRLVLADNHQLVVESGAVRYEIACMPDKEFPQGATDWEPVQYSFAPGVLPRLINAVSHAASQDPLKHNLCGVYLGMDSGRLTAVATDGHRMALAGIDGDHELPQPFLLPGKAAAILAKIDSGIGLSYGTPRKNDNQIYFESATGLFGMSVRLLEGSFPAYRRVIPTDHPEFFTVDATALADAIDAVSVIGEGKARSVNLHAPEDLMGEALNVSAISLAGVASATVPCMGGSGYRVSACARYLVQALSALKGEVFIKHGGKNPGILISPVDHVTDGIGFDERLEIIMPLGGK